jgi:protein RecA
MAGTDREKALDAALAQIERQFGKGAVMRLGERPNEPIDVIPTGSTALDVALGVGGLPRGRVVEVYGPESSGKCLTADTLIWTDKGLETVEELFGRCGQKASCTSRVTDISEFDVRVVNERGRLEKVTALTHNNRKPVLKIKLKSGRTITGTRNHPLRVISERGYLVWRRTDRIRPGDTVVSASFGAAESSGNDWVSEDEAVFLGYLAAEGSLSYRTRIAFTNQDEEVGADFTAAARGVLGDDITVRYYNGQEYRINSKALCTLLAERYGLDYATAAGKSVPACIRTGGQKMQRVFLSALFEGDGWIDTSSSIGLGTASEQLACEVQLLLYGLGIPASVYSEFNTQYQRHYWSVIIDPSVAHRFLETVGFRSARRRAQVEANLKATSHDPQFENIPNISGIIRDLRDDLGGNREFDRIAGDLFCSDMNLACSRSRLQRLVAWCENRVYELPPTGRAIHDYLKFIASSDFTYEEVVEVEDAGEQPTFDIVVPETHSFIANGVLSHNTTLTLHAVANAQKTGGVVAFVDAEHALDPEYAKKLGVDIDSLILSQPDNGEQALEIVDMLIRSGALDLIVIDSVAALVPRAEIEGEMGDSHVGLQARLMSQALRKITGALNQSKTTAIFINQLREKVGIVFGSPETTTGGRALKFYSSVRLDIRRIETLKDGTEAVGNRTRVKVVKNKVAPPFKQAEFDILYGQGISREGGLIDMGVEHGFIRKSGAWYTYEGDQLGQGKENARNFLKDNPDLANEIEKKIKEKLGIGVRADAAGGDPGTDAATGAATPVAKAEPAEAPAKAAKSARSSTAKG